jgi:membrane fusion protein, multidrug efflux system
MALTQQGKRQRLIAVLLWSVDGVGQGRKNRHSRFFYRALGLTTIPLANDWTTSILAVCIVPEINLDWHRQTPMRQTPSWWGKSVLPGLAATAALALAGCGGSKNAYVPPPPPKVVVAQPVKMPATLYLNLTGNTVAFNAVNLVARVQGYLESIDYKDGAAVTKGTQLFGIERDIYQAQLDQANAQLARDQTVLAEAQRNLVRYQELVKTNAVSQQTYDDQRFLVEQDAATVAFDKANVETAKINLGYTRVLAPFDGVVTNHLVDLGAFVGMSGPTTLASIVQTDPIYVYFSVSEPQVLAIGGSKAKAGLSVKTSDLTFLSSVPVEIGLQGEQGYNFKGHLDYASPQVDSSTGTLTVRAVFENGNRALLPGLFVHVRVPIGHQDEALLTRSDAIGASQEGSYVLVVGSDDVVQRKIVKTGQKQGQLQIIESGLDPSDWVVTEGIQRAFPGAKVAPQRSELKSVADSPSDAAKSTVTDPESK